MHQIIDKDPDISVLMDRIVFPFITFVKKHSNH